MTAQLKLANAVLWSPDLPEPVDGADILVAGGRVAEIVPAGTGGPAETVVDCAGRWVLPGLIDSHMHSWGARSPNPVHWVVGQSPLSWFRAVGDLRRVLDAGFTTVREAGGPLGPGLRDAIAEGEVAGPRVIPAHLGISRTGGHGDCHSLPIAWVGQQPYMARIADGPDEVRTAVRMAARDGGEWVKIWASGAIALSDHDSPEHLHFSVEELEVICREAHALGMTVGAHVEFPSAIKACVRAGVDVIEHGFILDEETCLLMAERGVPVVSTMALLHRYLRWDGPEITEAQVEMARTLLPSVHASALLAYRSGVTVAIGSDSFAEPLTPFGANAEELLALREAGLPAEACLTAATINGARVAGREKDLGSVTVGKIADLIVTGRTSPLDDLNAVVGPDKIALVLRDGVPVAGTGLRRSISL
ncbi:metal-dependent hydrolase family protein [Nonomuraea insulae]|uniref:Amidohydrolase family protein n=1 Tax=Nonomuraea insulae TaxID=1616787 RepID=A0ABW1CPE9_9ACTN